MKREVNTSSTRQPTGQEDKQMKKVLNGWFTIVSYDVYVDDGRVTHAMRDGKCYHPYIVNKKYGGYDLDTTLSLSALRARLTRGTAIFA